MSQSRENLRTDGRTDGQILFCRTLPAEAGGPKRKRQLFGQKGKFHDTSTNRKGSVHKVLGFKPHR